MLGKVVVKFNAQSFKICLSISAYIHYEIPNRVVILSMLGGVK